VGDTNSPSSSPTVSPTNVGDTNSPTVAPTNVGDTNFPFYPLQDFALCELIFSTNLNATFSVDGWKCTSNFVPITTYSPFVCADQWTGLTCEEGKITSIVLTNLGLSGFLPESFGSFSNLTHLSLSGNSFFGPFPESFQDLISLTSVDVSRNYFGLVSPQRRKLQVIGEPSPLEIFAPLSKLEYLNVGGNSFTGEVPESLCNLPLKSLVLNDNTRPKYPTNNFSCISSCLVENQELVLSIPASLAVCVVTSPTAAPSSPLDSLANQPPTLTSNWGSIIFMTLGFFCFCFICFIFGSLVLKRYQTQNELKSEAEILWKEKQESRLHLAELSSVASSSNSFLSSKRSSDQSSVVSESTLSSATQPSFLSLSSKSKSLGNNIRTETQNSFDLSFPVVISFDDDDEDSDDHRDVFATDGDGIIQAGGMNTMSSAQSGSSSLTGDSSFSSSTLSQIQMHLLPSPRPETPRVHSIDIQISDETGEDSLKDDNDESCDLSTSSNPLDPLSGLHSISSSASSQRSSNISSNSSISSTSSSSVTSSLSSQSQSHSKNSWYQYYAPSTNPISTLERRPVPRSYPSSSLLDLLQDELDAKQDHQEEAEEEETIQDPLSSATVPHSAFDNSSSSSNDITADQTGTAVSEHVPPHFTTFTSYYAPMLQLTPPPPPIPHPVTTSANSTPTRILYRIPSTCSSNSSASSSLAQPMDNKDNTPPIRLRSQLYDL
jgi:hypothetical protein